MTNREDFEAKFPVPKGVVYVAEVNQYVPAKDGQSAANLSWDWQMKWEAWQDATAQQDALIAAAYEDAADEAFKMLNAALDIAFEEGTIAVPVDKMMDEYIRSRTPADARAALDEHDKRLISIAYREITGAIIVPDGVLQAIINQVKGEAK